MADQPVLPDERRSIRQVLLVLGGTAILIAVLYFLIPRLAGAQETWERIKDGSPAWLVAAVVLEAISYVGYAWLVSSVSAVAGIGLSFGLATQITLAATAATRLLAAGGAGGIAVTAYALSRAGHGAQGAARQVATHLVTTYAVFTGTMIAFGTGMAMAGEEPALTALPAVIGAILAALFVLVVASPVAMERMLGKGGHWRRRLLAAPRALAGGATLALDLVRRREPGLLGAATWWAFDMATLWATFHAFGGSPQVPELVMGYLVGMIANLLPLPGGVGGVEGGMVGAYAAFGLAPGLALVAVLAYRGISVWLPALPGLAALATLRRGAEQANA